MAQKSLQFLEFTAGADDAGRRLDRVVRKFLVGVPLGAIYRAIRTGSVLVNGARQSESYRVKAGDGLGLARELVEEGTHTSAHGLQETPRMHDEAHADLAASIIFENEHVLVVNKPPGALVHGDASLEQEVRGYLAPKLPASLSFRPGPLHRLDRNTSGLLAFGVSKSGAERFSALLREGRMQKVYLALLDGSLQKPEAWADPLARDSARHITRVDPSGKIATTSVTPLITAKGRTLAAVEIGTGRTHQIRAQAAGRGYPLSGDKKYGSAARGPYLLHSFLLRLPRIDPILGFSSLNAPLPPGAERALRALFDSRELSRALRRAESVAPIGRR